MNKYLESIESMEQVGTAPYKQSAPDSAVVLEVSSDTKDVIENAVIDFKHYFTVPMTYLIAHKKDRILHLDDLFAEQVTLKFSTYLARVAIP